MDLIFDFFFVLFAFSLGGIFFLSVIIIFLVGFLRVLRSKCTEIKQRAKLSKPIINNQKKSKIKNEKSRDSELQGYIKIQTTEQSKNGPNQDIEWCYGVLKSNFLFTYTSKEKNGLKDVICLDECELQLLNQKNWAATKNGIEISHSTRNLLNEDDSTNVEGRKIFFFSIASNELEKWYWALKAGSQLLNHSEKVAEKENEIRNYFSKLRGMIYKDHTTSTNPFDWINATLPRFWWNLFTNKSFHKFIVKRLSKRIAKITDFPKIIDTMVLQKLQIGPNLPVITNIVLDTMSEDGEIDIDLDVEYNGGLALTIKIIASISLPGTSLEVPASAVIHLNQLKGKLRLHVSPPPCERFWAGFHELPHIDVFAETQIGIIDTAQNSIPKIAEKLIRKLRGDVTKVIVNKLKSDIIGERMVLPHMDDFPIPYFTHHDEENDDDYLDQVILSRSQKQSHKILQFSPERVTILNKHLSEMPLINKRNSNSLEIIDEESGESNPLLTPRGSNNRPVNINNLMDSQKDLGELKHKGRSSSVKF